MGEYYQNCIENSRLTLWTTPENNESNLTWQQLELINDNKNNKSKPTKSKSSSEKYNSLKEENKKLKEENKKLQYELVNLKKSLYHVKKHNSNLKNLIDKSNTAIRKKIEK